ncbi:relaxase, partial [Herbaspirillum sp. HC18]
MILKGGPRAKAAELAAHLLRTDTNETVRVMGFEGVAAQSVRGALMEMEAVAAGGRTGKPLYHISISPEADELLTDAEWALAADRLGRALGMADHQRLMVLHTKNGRQHAHIAWNRVNIETLKTAHHSH